MPDPSPGRPREQTTFAGLVALGAPEPMRARLAEGLLVALGALGLLAASAGFAWGTARTLHGDALPRLAGLLALVLAARALRRSPAATTLLGGPDRGGLWRDRLGACAEGVLALAAVSAALDQVWAVLGR